MSSAPMCSDPLPEPRRPRAGLSLRRAHLRELLAAADGQGPELLEVVVDHFFHEPDALRPLAERYPIVLHDTGLSLGTPGPLDHERVARVAAVARASRAERLTEHIAITRSPSGIDLGHLAPVPRLPAFLTVLTEHCRALQDTLGLPIALENPATPFRFPGEMPEGEFLHALVERADIGLLVDLSNLFVDEGNGHGSARGRLEAWPLHRAVQAHVAGSKRVAAGWIDSHDRPVEDGAWALLSALRGRAPLDAIVLERDTRLPPLAQLVAEARSAIGRWSEARPVPMISPAPPSQEPQR